MNILLDGQIACFKREIGLRKRLYPIWVKQRKMSQVVADYQIAAMEVVLKTLLEVQKMRETELELR